jgi:hypothetical protein
LLHHGFLKFVSHGVGIVDVNPFCGRNAWVAGRWAGCSWAVFGVCDGLVVMGPVLRLLLVLVELLRHFNCGLE